MKTKQDCVRCLIKDGVRILDFVNVDDVIAWALLMHVATSEGWMPPSTSDLNCREYNDSELLDVSEAFIGTIARWMNNDYPMGDSSNAKEYNNASQPPQNSESPTHNDEEIRQPLPVKTWLVRNIDAFCYIWRRQKTFYQAIHPVIGNT